MHELDFLGLRIEVEASTRLPEFGAVERRAARIRARDRLAVAGVLVATLGMIAPAAVAGLRAHSMSGPAVTSPDTVPEQPVEPSPSASTDDRAVVQVRILAVDGFDLRNLYAAVDVCAEPAAAPMNPTRPGHAGNNAAATQETANRGPDCSLQVTRLGDTGRSPLVIEQLRQSRGDSLTDVQLTALSPTSLLLSGVPGGGPRAFVRVNVLGGSAPVSPVPASTGHFSIGDRIVQLTHNGPIFGVRQSDDAFAELPHQPPLAEPVAATSVDPSLGWWVTGIDRSTREVAVAVSRDLGQTWTTRRLGVRAGAETPVVASHDGQIGYAFLADTGGFTAYRTVDWGNSWNRVPAELRSPQPSRSAPGAQAGAPGSGLGAIIRPDGSILLRLPDGAPLFVESHDGGTTFASAAAPGASVVATPGGYVTIDDLAETSVDGRSWTPLPVPAYLPPH
jgi:hypothetical protein